MTETPEHDDGWPWPEELDACVAAPQSHRLLFENDFVRVLEVTIEPGAREPVHTHRAPSVMIVDQPARIRYYTGEKLTFETPLNVTGALRVSWLEPEPPHSVENVDVHPYHAYRIELRVTRGLSLPTVEPSSRPAGSVS